MWDFQLPNVFILQVSPTTTKFTEDFDFEAMNEKFNKKKIWGHLGKTNISRLEDKEGDEKANDANDVEEDDVDEDGLPNFDPKVKLLEFVNRFPPPFLFKIQFPEFAHYCSLFMLRMTSLIRFLASHSIVGWGEEGPSYPNKGK